MTRRPPEFQLGITSEIIGDFSKSNKFCQCEGMTAGRLGLLAVTAEIMPEMAESIIGSLRGERGRGVALQGA
jgi:hypothetical protein